MIFIQIDTFKNVAKIYIFYEKREYKQNAAVIIFGV